MNISKKPKFLIVGAYPARNVYGGFVTDCIFLRSSEVYYRYSVYEFDSTQISNPPPRLLVRSFLSFFKLLRFLLIILNNRFEVAIFLLPNGAGAIEKILWAIFLQISNRKVKIFMLPRANALFNEISNIPNFIINLLFGLKFKWLTQGNKAFEVIRSYNKNNQSEIIFPFITAQENVKFEVNMNKIRFIFVGWLEKSKGVIELLESLKLISKNFEIIFVGNGSLCNLLEERAVKDHRIKRTGWIKYSDVLKEISLADCLILPSFQEGMPNVVAEAMALGRAVISTDVGEISTILPAEQLISSNCPKLIAKAMNDILSIDGLLVNKMKLNYEIALKYFGISAFDKVLFNKLDI